MWAEKKSCCRNWWKKYVDQKKHQMITYIIGKSYDKKFLQRNIKKLSDVDRQKKSLFSTGGKKKSLQATKTLVPKVTAPAVSGVATMDTTLDSGVRGCV